MSLSTDRRVRKKQNDTLENFHIAWNCGLNIQTE
jgi:hypothetical protein